eukprot:2447388-Pleurochrysis_carterae.AAC.1
MVLGEWSREKSHWGIAHRESHIGESTREITFQETTCKASHSGAELHLISVSPSMGLRAAPRCSSVSASGP